MGGGDTFTDEMRAAGHTVTTWGNAPGDRYSPHSHAYKKILCCLEGRTQEEAARQLGWTPGAVKGRLERGRAKLHRSLVKRGLTLSAVLVATAGALSCIYLMTQLGAENWARLALWFVVGLNIYFVYGYVRNAEAHKRVMRKHAAANDSVRSVGADDARVLHSATKAWQECLAIGEKNGWRNAQAPTGNGASCPLPMRSGRWTV